MILKGFLLNKITFPIGFSFSPNKDFFVFSSISATEVKSVSSSFENALPELIVTPLTSK